jgi:hypothetical protein
LNVELSGTRRLILLSIKAALHRREEVMRYESYGAYILCIALFVVGGSLRVTAQGGQLRIDYTVEVADTQAHLLHVTSEIKNIRQPRLDLSLPAWTPGLYRLENYTRNVLSFKVGDARGG